MPLNPGSTFPVVILSDVALDPGFENKSRPYAICTTSATTAACAVIAAREIEALKYRRGSINYTELRDTYYDRKSRDFI